jgi:uracil-DNA glycosylase
MSDKLSQLDAMMRDVAACQLCCREGGEIKKEKLLRNLIAEKPNGPRYGEIPSRYTDWAHRLDAKIAFVLEDYGSAHNAFEHRESYLRRITEESLSPEVAWRRTVEDRPHPSPSTLRIPVFLRQSAERQGLELPRDFLDGILFTNAVLCFRRAGNDSSKENIDWATSSRNCCTKRRFLRQQLQILGPSVVVAAGKKVLGVLGVRGTSIAEAVEDAHRSGAHGFSRVDYGGLSLNMVPVFHPAARPKDRSADEQVESHRFIWRALSHILGLAGNELVRAVFPTLEVDPFV